MDKIIIFIMILLLIGVATASDTPIVSDKKVKDVETLRVVDKDELQRIFRDYSDRITNLEKRVARIEQTSQGGL